MQSLPKTTKYLSVLSATVRYVSNAPKELKIPVPWGHIAAQQFGRDELPSIICCHGYGGNSNTFVPLMECIGDTHFKYICIDLPGHGRSSHLPAGFFYTNPVYNYAIAKTRRFLKEDKVGLLGHSMGSAIQIIMVHACPQTVKFCIGIELSTLPEYPQYVRFLHLQRRIDKIMNQENRKSPRPLSRKNIMLGIHEANDGTMDEKAVELFFERSMMEVEEGKFTPSWDRKVMNNQVFGETFGAPRDPLNVCPADLPILLIDATRGIRFSSEKWLENSLQNTAKLYGTIERHIVDGHHHVHTSNAPAVTAIMRQFLQNKK